MLQPRNRLFLSIWGGCVLVCLIVGGWALLSPDRVAEGAGPHRSLVMSTTFTRQGDIDAEFGYPCRVYTQTKPYPCTLVICDKEFGLKNPALSCH